MSSRLGFDAQGRMVAEGTCVELRGLRWLVLGNLINSTVNGEKVLFGWLGLSGHPPSPRERAAARPPYEAAGTRRERKRRQEVPDELLAEQEAIRLARLEQQRQPVDLIQALAA